MVKVYGSSIINAPAETVWAYIRDFEDLPKWLPIVADCGIEGGLPSDQVGCVRSILMKDGSSLRERLLGLSDHDYRCVYAIIESQTGADNYVGTIKLTPITDGDRTVIEWSADFDAAPADQKRIADFVADGIFQVAFDALKGHFSHR